MSNTVDVYFLFKIMPIEYIDNFAKGNFYFSCCGNWVDIAKKGFGKGQGDKYEGVFAKYKRKNSRKPVKYYKTLFKNRTRRRLCIIKKNIFLIYSSNLFL